MPGSVTDEQLKMAPKSGSKRLNVHVQRFAETMLRIAPTMKHPSFAAEREWRLVRAFGESMQFNWQFRTKGSMLVPYTTINLPTNDFGSIGSERIIVGPSAHMTTNLTALYPLCRRYRVAAKCALSKIPYRDWQARRPAKFNRTPCRSHGFEPEAF